MYYIHLLYSDPKMLHITLDAKVSFLIAWLNMFV